MPDLFLSHSSTDDQRADEMADALEAQGLTVWVDHRNGIMAGNPNWDQAIRRAISDCGAALLLMSPRSLASEICAAECALVRELGRPLYVGYLDTCKPEEIWLFIKMIQYADLRTDPATGIAKLVTAIRGTGAPGDKTLPTSVPNSTPPNPPGSKVQRHLEAAMPQQTKLSSSTELWIKISLPGSVGLRGELPAIVPSGDVIQKEDTRSSSFPISFPYDQKTNTFLPAILCAEAVTNDFRVKVKQSPRCDRRQTELELPPDSDSRTLVLTLVPKSATKMGRSRVIVNVFHEGRLIAQTSVSTEIVEVVGRSSVWELATALLSLAPGGNPLLSATLPMTPSAAALSNESLLAPVDAFLAEKPTRPTVSPGSSLPSPVAPPPTAAPRRVAPRVPLAYISLLAVVLFAAIVVGASFTARPPSTEIAAQTTQAAVLSTDTAVPASATAIATVATPAGHLLRTFSGPADVWSVAFSPDSKTILTGGGDDTAILWDVAGGQRLRTFGRHTFGVNSVAFSPDGARILDGSCDNTAIVWDVASGSVLRTLSGHKACVTSVAFAPNGKTVLTGSADKTTILWDYSTGQQLHTFSSTDQVLSVAFSPDGKNILTGGFDKTMTLWDVASGQQLRTFSGPDAVTSVAFSPDGKTVLMGTLDEAILSDLASGQQLRTFSDHTNLVKSVAFSPDSKSILTGGGYAATLWDVASGQALRTFSGHADVIWSVAFAPDGKSILTGSEDKAAMLWDISDLVGKTRASG